MKALIVTASPDTGPWCGRRLPHCQAAVDRTGQGRTVPGGAEDQAKPSVGSPRPSVVEDIARHRKEFPPQVVYVEDRTNPRKPVWRHARLLYTSEIGGAIRRGSWAKVWARNVKRANSYKEKSGSKVRVPEGTTLHDLRHFYASVLIKNRATPKQVQMRLGHAKPSITLTVYTHLWEAEADRTADMMMKAVLSDVP
ncbi:tyrosine-type recombinase/integrase [Streptomyces sp. NPDC056653]|uniref:tyrosine-type recombinase/integrase n=1 Tax=Streptomyces sp. NPDC056653 TaxID=3345894 RepID=UPI0036B7AC3E